MQRIINTFCALLLILPLLCGCSEDAAADKATLTYEGNEIAATGGEAHVTVSANGTWILQSSADWATLSTKSGKGDTEVNITFASNSQYSSRKAKLTLQSGSASDNCEITQAAAERPTKEPSDDQSDSYLCFPKQNPDNTLVIHNADLNGTSALNYAIEWNQSMKHAQWVAFYFDAQNCAKNATRNNEFIPDPLLPTAMQIDNSYHTSDGFDRGHLCASYDRFYSQEANNQTFYFSNMSPQLNEFNAGIWQKMESEVQYWGTLTKNGKYDKVHVAKGGTLNHLLKNFSGTIKGQDGQTPTTDANGLSVKGLPVPEYYFMAILAEKDGQYESIAFLVNHVVTDVKDNYTVADIKKYIVSIDALEEFTGLDFFCNLPDNVEESVESKMNAENWLWQ